MNIDAIIDDLVQNKIIDNPSVTYKPLRGGTSSDIGILTSRDGCNFVVKSNRPDIIKAESYFLNTYDHLKVLPKLKYVSRAYEYLVYTFLEGKGYTSADYKYKNEILHNLITNLIYHYAAVPESLGWGWLDEPTDSWQSFMKKRVQETSEIVASILPIQDIELINQLVSEKGRYDHVTIPYLLHGDLGVHNFLLSDKKLSGVIDAMPVVGEPLYDLIYAFCSSPDDLTIEHFNEVADQLSAPHYSNKKLYEELLIGLYFRLGACIKHHPLDLDSYMIAWDVWRTAVIR